MVGEVKPEGDQQEERPEEQEDAEDEEEIERAFEEMFVHKLLSILQHSGNKYLLPKPLLQIFRRLLIHIALA